MTTCSLFVGWRGTGKSTLARRLAKELNAPLFERDLIRLELIRGRYYNPYSYNPRIEIDILIKRLRDLMPKKPKVIFLDYFTIQRREREDLLLRLRVAGISQIEAIRVTTPCDFSYQQFKAREESLGEGYFSDPKTYRRNFSLMEEESEDIENDGFDAISYADARQLCLW
jgi:predicted kinase